MIKGMIENKKLMIFCDACKIKNESQGIFSGGAYIIMRV